MYCRRISPFILTLLLVFSAVRLAGAEQAGSKISFCIYAYPREVVLDINATVVPDDFIGEVRRLTFLLAVDNLYNASEGSIIMDAFLRRVDVPAEVLIALNYTEPVGRGLLQIFFLKPAEFQGLQQVDLDFNFTIWEETVGFSALFNVSIAMDYASSSLIELIEEAEALSKTEAGINLLRQRVRELFGDWLNLKEMKMCFDRNKGLLTGSVKAEADIQALLTQIMQAAPSFPNLQIEEVPSVSRLHLAFRIDGSSVKIYAAWRMKERAENLFSGLRDLGAGVELSRFKVGVRRSLRIEAYYTIAEGKMLVSVRGLRLTLKENPEETFNVVMEWLRELEAENPSLIEKVVIVAGSDQDYEAVIWHAGSTHRVLTLSSPYEFSGSMTVARNKWSIADYEVYTGSIQVDGSAYTVTVASNSTVRSIVLWDRDKLAFNVEGREETLGALNASIPRAVLGGADPKTIKVYAGGVELENAIIKADQDAVRVYATYMHNVYTVMVKWIPPQQTQWMHPIIFVIVGAAAGAIVGIIIMKRRK